MEELEKAHRKKLMSKVKTVILDDIISTIGVIIERSNFIVKARVYGNKVIALDSYVDGCEGSYQLMEIDVKLVDYRHKLVPKIIITSIISSKNPVEMLLPQVTVRGMLEAFEKSFIGRERNVKEYVIEETQSERIDLMEVVADIIDSIDDNYFITGVSRYSKNLI